MSKQKSQKDFYFLVAKTASWTWWSLSSSIQELALKTYVSHFGWIDSDKCETKSKPFF